MGCWNETCGITNLPILSGQPVRLFFLAGKIQPNEGHAGFCNPNTHWTPRFLAIRGTYDDYGSLEDIHEDWNTRWIIGEVREAIVEVRLRKGAASDADDPWSPKHNDLDLGGDLCINDLLDAIHEDSLWIPGTRGNISLGWMMVHEWAYQRLTREMERDWKGNLTLAEVVEHGREWYAKIEERQHDSAGKFDFVQNPDVVDWKNPFAMMNGRGRDLDGYGVLRGIGSYVEIAFALASQGHDARSPEVSELITALAEHITFACNMSLLRRSWTP